MKNLKTILIVMLAAGYMLGADTIRSQADVLALHPDNTGSAISAQDLRDAIVSQAVYGSISFDGAGTPVEQTGITTTPAVLTAFDTDGATSGVTADSTTNDDLEVLTAGDCEVGASISAFSDTSGGAEEWVYEIYKNGTGTGCAARRDFSGTSGVGSISVGPCTVSCAANDAFDLRIAPDTGTEDHSTETASLYLNRVK